MMYIRSMQLSVLLGLLVMVSSIEAQEKRNMDAPYLIPQTVFAGDRGRLVIPLDAVFKDAKPVILQKSDGLPSSENLVIHRIELERRGENVRLLIDFTAYIPGFVPLPALEIPFLDSKLFLSAGIGVTIASILEGDSMVLSDPAAPLAIPGTSFLIYGTTTFFFLVFLLGIGLRVWGKNKLISFREQFRRKRLIRLMGKTLGRLRNDIERDKPAGIKEEEVLDRLSTEFRTFLSLFTGMQCHTMTPGEFILLPAFSNAEPYQSVLSGTFLCGIFRHCDILRFSGTMIKQHEMLSILEEIQGFLNALNQAEKEHNRFHKVKPAVCCLGDTV